MPLSTIGFASGGVEGIDRTGGGRAEEDAARAQEASPDGGSILVPALATGNAAVDSLISGVRWQIGQDDHTIQYSFATGSSAWRADYGNDEPGFWAGDFSAAEKLVIKKALGAWSEVADIRFTEVPDTSGDVGDLRFGRSTLPSTAWAYLPDGGAEGGDVWLGQQRFPSLSDAGVVDWIYTPGTWRYFTLMHEIGHTLGLLHPHDGADGVGAALEPGADWIGASIMSYRSHPNQELGQGYSVEIYPSSPMGLDIAAVQSLYGASHAQAGDTHWSWSTDERIYQAIWDFGGNDTIDWSNQKTAATIRLEQGSWSDLGEPFRWGADSGGSLPGTVFIAIGTDIENAIGGSGGDRIEGSNLANRLEGRAGNDVLLGAAGGDSLFGGSGDDRMEGGGGNDLASGQDGADLIRGGTGNDALYGFSGDDRLYGESGRDSLYGGDGADRLYGETGDDLLDGGNGNDWLYGGTADNRLYGGAGDDTLFGGGGDDRLYGGSGRDVADAGSGADIINGDDGDDIVIAWYGGDIINGGSGSDIVSVGFVAAGFRLEGTSSNGRLIDTDIGNGDLGSDQFTSIECIMFTDKTLGWRTNHWEIMG